MAERPIDYTLVFAEIYTNNQEFENFLTRLRFIDGAIDFSGLPTYNDLPDQLQLGGLEEFANSLSEATQSDPDRQERGGWAHIQSDRPTLLFPYNPTIGTTKYDSERELIMFLVNPHSINTEKTKPAVFVHSHPISRTFSIEDAFNFFRDDNDVDPIASIVSTPKYNFLLLRSSETSGISLEEFNNFFSKYMEHAWTHGGEIYQSIMFQLSLSNIDPDYFSTLIDKFGGDAGEFYQDLITLMLLSKECRAGFYISDKDGVYKRLDREKIIKLMEKIFINNQPTSLDSNNLQTTD